MSLLDFLVDFAVVDGLLLIGRGRREEHHEIVAFFSGHFRSRTRGDFIQRDVVHHYVGIVLLSPCFGVDAIEPLVVIRHEVAPLQNFQGLLLRLRAPRKKKCRPDPRSQRARTRKSDEVPPRNSTRPFFWHLSLPP